MKGIKKAKVHHQLMEDPTPKYGTPYFLIPFPKNSEKF